MTEKDIDKIVHLAKVEFCRNCGCGISRDTCTSLGTCKEHDNFSEAFRKQIEERAKEYAPDPFLAALERKAYIAGATEQKAIDIDKACEWFEGYLAEIGYPDDWCRDSEVQESGEKRFRKAMEK